MGPDGCVCAAPISRRRAHATAGYNKRPCYVKVTVEAPLAVARLTLVSFTDVPKMQTLTPAEVSKTVIL